MGMLGFGIILFLLLISILAPLLAPETDGHWTDTQRWSDNPRSAAPSWVDYILPGRRAPHDIREHWDEYDDEYDIIRYFYNNEYDRPPSDITVFVAGTSQERNVRIFIDLIRPDGTTIQYVNTQQSVTNDTFRYRFTLRASGVDGGRARTYDFGLDAHQEFHEYFLFNLDINIREHLSEGTVSRQVRDIFEANGYPIPSDAQLILDEEGFRDQTEDATFPDNDNGFDGNVTFPENGDDGIPENDDENVTWYPSWKIVVDGEELYAIEDWGDYLTANDLSAIRPPESDQVDLLMIPFAKRDENILLSPESLKGDYILEVEVMGLDEFNEDTTRVLFRGRKYGLMGTDNSRRDIALGWVWGARYALIIGTIVSLCTVGIALLYGMTSAYYGGWVDEVMQRVNEILLGIPLFPILVLTMFAIERSIWIFVLLYSLLGWRGLAKIIRARGIQIRQDTYVEAAQSLGSSGGRVITRHMIPQLLPYAIAEGALMIPLIVIAEAGLSVLGLADPNVVTWGRMLAEANRHQATITGMWWWVLMPGLGLTLLGFGFITTGMALEKVINPKMRQR